MVLSKPLFLWGFFFCFSNCMCVVLCHCVAERMKMILGQNGNDENLELLFS